MEGSSYGLLRSCRLSSGGQNSSKLALCFPNTTEQRKRFGIFSFHRMVPYGFSVVEATQNLFAFLFLPQHGSHNLNSFLLSSFTIFPHHARYPYEPNIVFILYPDLALVSIVYQSFGWFKLNLPKSASFSDLRCSRPPAHQRCSFCNL